MPRGIRRFLLMAVCAAALFSLFSLGANAYTYPSMPDNWQEIEVTVGTVTMPLSRYPDGSTYSPDKRYMTVEEQQDYGFNIGTSLDLRGWECVGFARYVYSALFYKYPQDATIDTSLAYGYANSYAYRNMIEEVLGTQVLSPGYSSSTLKTVITACQPGAVMRVGGHSMVIMAIFDDGLIIYDANFSYDNEVNVRAYTWQTFVNSFGGREMSALHMPAYYPGYSYSTGGGSGSSEDYELDTSAAGLYQVYDCSSLNVRDAPSTSGTWIGSLASGEIVTVLGTYGGWAKIEYGGGQYWAHMDYLTPYTMTISVTFDPNGGSASYTSNTYTAGSAFGSMPSAQKSGRSLLGWSDGTSLYNAESIVPSVSTLALKARWCVLDYMDVPEEEWYAPYVEDAYYKKLISYDTMFNPNETATRAHMITLLGREYERETGTTISNSGSTIFVDVPDDMYYAKYVGWGNQNGLVKGVGDNYYDPDGAVTREQIVEFLYRLAIFTGETRRQQGDLSVLSRFSDGDTVSDYAVDGMCWAIQVKIIQGDDLGMITPQKPAERCEMITMMSRYIDYLGANTEQWIAVNFDPNGGSMNSQMDYYLAGSTFGSLPTPEKAYRTFQGWYYGDTLYTGSSTVPDSGITLTARWSVLNYTDVTEEDWFVPYLEKGYDCSLVDGQGTFAPWTDATRSDVATYMARCHEYLSGTLIPEPDSIAFQDVNLGDPYAKYVAWGNQNGLINGTDEGIFSPNDSATRQQISMFLYRLAVWSGVTSDQETDVTVLDRFNDGTSVEEFYQRSMSWAVTVGIFGGDDLNNLNPLDNASRADIITMMVRYINYASA